MDSVTLTADRQPKAEWQTPVLQRLDVSTGTEADPGKVTDDGEIPNGAS